MYARQFDDKTLTFGVSGKLIMNALVMYDHQTDTLWSHFTGDAISGPLARTRLETVPATQTTFGRWKELHPDTLVLSQGLGAGYDPYGSYYRGGRAGVLGERRRDDRLYTKEFVVGLVVNGVPKAYAFGDLNDQPVVNDTVGEEDLLVTFDPVSATGVAFHRDVTGDILTFRPLETGEGESPMMVDDQTGSRWLILTGEAIDGELKGAQLQPLSSNYAFWFAWKDWHPSTLLFSADLVSP